MLSTMIMYIIHYLLDQFKIKDYITLNVPVLGNLHLSVTNMGLYLMIALFIVFALTVIATKFNKLVSNNWSIAQDSMYANLWARLNIKPNSLLVVVSLFNLNLALLAIMLKLVLGTNIFMVLSGNWFSMFLLAYMAFSSMFSAVFIDRYINKSHKSTASLLIWALVPSGIWLIVLLIILFWSMLCDVQITNLHQLLLLLLPNAVPIGVPIGVFASKESSTTTTILSVNKSDRWVTPDMENAGPSGMATGFPQGPPAPQPSTIQPSLTQMVRGASTPPRVVETVESTLPSLAEARGAIAGPNRNIAIAGPSRNIAIAGPSNSAQVPTTSQDRLPGSYGRLANSMHQPGPARGPAPTRSQLRSLHQLITSSRDQGLIAEYRAQRFPTYSTVTPLTVGDFLNFLEHTQGNDEMLRQVNFLKHVLQSDPNNLGRHINANPAFGVKWAKLFIGKNYSIMIELQR